MVFQDSDLAKWLEAVAYQLALGGCGELREKAEEAIDLVVRAQMPDGYLNTYFQCKAPDKRWTNLRDCHELYCAGHMMEAAVAWYQATGERKLLDAMLRFARHIADHIGHGERKIPGVPGHEEIELALCRMYDVTGEDFLLDLASYFVDERGQEPDYLVVEHPDHSNDHWSGIADLGRRYAQHQAPVREQEKLEGHAVRALYLVTGMADVAQRKKDEGLLNAARRLFLNAVDKRMYITGGVGSTCIGEAFTYDYDLPNDTAYAETCASIALIFRGAGAAAGRAQWLVWRCDGTGTVQYLPGRHERHAGCLLLRKSAFCASRSQRERPHQKHGRCPPGPAGLAAPAARPTWPGCSVPWASMLTAPPDRKCVCIFIWMVRQNWTRIMALFASPCIPNIPPAARSAWKSTATVTWRFACLGGATEAMTCL